MVLFISLNRMPSKPIYNLKSKFPEGISDLETLGTFLGEVYTNDTRTTVGTSRILFCVHERGFDDTKEFKRSYKH